MTIHKPVLLKEVIEYLNPQPGQNFIDCTYGGGGHSCAILDKIGSGGKLLAIDANSDVKKHEEIKEIKGNKNFKLVIDNFRNLENIIKKNNFPYPIHGILIDLGLSSDELEKSSRGFSFQKNEPLDMRFDVNQDLTAAFILNSYSQENLYAIFKNLGEYPHARRLSQIIFKQRRLTRSAHSTGSGQAGSRSGPEGPSGPRTAGSAKKFTTTQDLVDVVLQVHGKTRHKQIHPATLVFQALRIAVNDELTSLVQVLPQAVQILNKGGRLVVISFHALEDRIVKNYFRNEARHADAHIKLLTKKPIVPDEDEVKKNPRSRSAKMRVVEKL